MNGTKGGLIILLNIVLTIVLSIVILQNTINAEHHRKHYQGHVVSQYYSPESLSHDFYPYQLDLPSLTHVFYGPFALDKDCKVYSPNTKADYEHNYPEYEVKGNLRLFSELKKKYTGLNVVLSVGGILHSRNYYRCSKEDHDRKKLIESVAQLLQEYNYDGVDYDWEFPSFLHKEHGYESYLQLVKDTRQYFQDRFPETQKYITITGSIEKSVIQHLEPYTKEFVQYVDYLNLMAFEYGGKWISDKTYLNAPLYKEEGSEYEELNVDYTVHSYERLGWPSQKILLGVPSYGRGYVGTEGLHQEYTEQMKVANKNGVLTWPEIKENYLKKEGWQRYWTEAKVPYLYNKQEKTLITYDDEESIKIKSRYALKKNLGGIFLFLAGDDYENELIKVVSHTYEAYATHNDIRKEM